MFGRKSTVSELTNAVLILLEGEAQGYEEARGFGAPSEVYDLISKSDDNRLIGLFAVSGWTAKDWETMVIAVTSSKFAYSIGTWDVVQRVQFERFTTTGFDPTEVLRDRITGEVFI